jgi:hypothetical protein
MNSVTNDVCAVEAFVEAPPSVLELPGVYV